MYKIMMVMITIVIIIIAFNDFYTTIVFSVFYRLGTKLRTSCASANLILQELLK